MPFFRTIKVRDGIIGTWHLTEEPYEFLNEITLGIADRERFDKIKSDKRRVEFLAARCLLNKVMSDEPQVSYSDLGKPFLENHSLNISISHSSDFVGVFLSEKNIGIDIERTDRMIDKVADRFLHPDEKVHIKQLNNQQLAKIVYWSAKEAIFKSSESQGIQFNNQIYIVPFNPELTTNFFAQLRMDNKTFRYRLSFQNFENNVLVYCVQE